MRKKYPMVYVPMGRNLYEASASALINESKRLGIKLNVSEPGFSTV